MFDVSLLMYCKTVADPAVAEVTVLHGIFMFGLDRIRPFRSTRTIAEPWVLNYIELN